MDIAIQKWPVLLEHLARSQFTTGPALFFYVFSKLVLRRDPAVYADSISFREKSGENKESTHSYPTALHASYFHCSVYGNATFVVRRTSRYIWHFSITGRQAARACARAHAHVCDFISWGDETASFDGGSNASRLVRVQTAKAPRFCQRSRTRGCAACTRAHTNTAALMGLWTSANHRVRNMHPRNRLSVGCFIRRF
jgi:hypothetical protein